MQCRIYVRGELIQSMFGRAVCSDCFSLLGYGRRVGLAVGMYDVGMLIAVVDSSYSGMWDEPQMLFIFLKI